MSRTTEQVKDPLYGSHHWNADLQRRAFPMLVRVLAVVVLVGVLIGGFAALLRWRQAADEPTTLPTAVHNPTPSLASSTCATLKLYPAPSHGNMSDLLNAVTVAAPRDAWAVGYSVVPLATVQPELRTRTLIEHWDGQHWQIVASPNGNGGAGQTENGILNAIVAISEKDIWAAGYYQARLSAESKLYSNTLIEHWNGVNWQIVPSPKSLSGNDRLSAIAATSADDVWAAGQTTMSDGRTQSPLLEHWDGKQWSIVSSFSLAGSTMLNGLAVTSAQNLWVAGGNYLAPTTKGLLARWDGSQWKLFPFPTVYPFGQLSASSPNDVWTSGTLSSGLTQVEHWDGQQWQVVPLPQFSSTDPYSVSLSGITSVTANDAWAVGTLRINYMEEQFLAIHWNGKTWQRVQVQLPNPQANNPANAVAVGDNQVWVVGDNEGHTPLIQGCA